ncbi:MAG: class I tRNA ligase family protein [Methanomassiliicoccales archaeon]|nr:class I tRNA ligase family protein [Methanomassiliicoccales archaeon]
MRLGRGQRLREKDVVHGKKLCTKMWNLGKFVESVVKTRPTQVGLHVTDRWILSRFSRTVQNATAFMENYQFDRAMKEVESFAWHEFADHYVEMVKHRVRDPQDEGVRYTLYTVYLGIIKMMAPMLPHVTEDAYQSGFVGMDGSVSIHISKWPEADAPDPDSEMKGEMVKDVISALRSWKSDRKMALNAEMSSVELIGSRAMTLKGCERDIAETVKAKTLSLETAGQLEERIVALKPVLSKIGPLYKANGKELVERIKAMEPESFGKAIMEGNANVVLADGTEVAVGQDIVEIQRSMALHGKMVETVQVGDILIVIEP